ncbi:SpoIIE family protein phosphatase [Streptomyces hokutonensis]|uniref:SpoIIE family protein phosphatase n=1 Tax=Streptomyces hokutonensis TaxID=1306990 RepID=UPI0003A8D5DE|nr:SpoIIE family protein phosphatase [Streptomyces hokutonensis]
MAGSATLLLDGRGVVVSWPATAERLLGYPAPEMVGRSAVGLLVSDNGVRVSGLVNRCRADGGWSGVVSVRHHDGRPAPVEVRVVRLPEGTGEACWLVSVQDAALSALWGLGPAVLARLPERSSVGMAVVDTELRCVWSNAALERFGGGTAAERLGRRLGQIHPGLDAAVLEAQMRRVLRNGAPVVGLEHVGRTRSDPHRDHAHVMSFVRIDDDLGRPLGVYYSVFDTTDRFRAQRRLTLLGRASEQIGRSLDVRRTAQDLADVAVPELADCVAVDLLEAAVTGAEPVPGPPGGDAGGRLLRLGRRGARADAAGTAGDAVGYGAGSPSTRVLATGRSWWAARLAPQAGQWAAGILTGGDPRPHTAMVVPVLARGITLGVATFVRARHDEPFDEEDLALAEELVARAAICLDNARRYTREHTAALVLQRSLLPHGMPTQHAVQAASYYRPADELSALGGDWYDVIPLSGARVALVVGEVPGHGIEAAATMGQLRTAIRTLADLDLPPEEVLAHLDDLITQTAREEQHTGAEPHSAGASEAASAVAANGSSCLYVVYDPVSLRCVMASAGHPAPVIVGPTGAAGFPDLPLGPVLGAGGMPFESVELTLGEGSVLALYTDGLIPEPEAGRDRLRRALAVPGLPLDRLCRRAVDALTPARPRADDAVLLLARTRSLDAAHVASWDLPSDPAVVARARAMAARQLGAWGLEDLAYTTELVVSELVTNAIRHAAGPIRLRLILERTLICEVFDASDSAPHLRHPRSADEGGRGLFLISQFTRRWGTRYTGDGKIIWAEQHVDHDVPVSGGAGTEAAT